MNDGQIPAADSIAPKAHALLDVGMTMTPAQFLTPREHFASGILDVVAELVGMLLGEGVITGEQLQCVMTRRAVINRQAHSDFNAFPAQVMANIAKDWNAGLVRQAYGDQRVMRNPEAARAIRSRADNEGAE